LSQTFPVTELLLVDDASDDPNVVKTLEKLAVQDQRVRVISRETQGGVSAARNTGVRQACGDYLAFLDDDDRWHAEKLAAQIDLLDELGNDCLFVACGLERTSFDGQKIYFNWPHVAGERWISYELFVQSLCAFVQTVLVHRSLLTEDGLFSEDIPVMEDFEWSLRLLQKTRGALVDRPLVFSQELMDGLTVKYHLRAEAIQRILERHAGLLSAYPRALSTLYYEQAKSLTMTGKRLPALKKLWSAWRNNPTDPRIYGMLLPAMLGHKAFMFARAIYRLFVKNPIKHINGTVG